MGCPVRYIPGPKWNEGPVAPKFRTRFEQLITISRRSEEMTKSNQGFTTQQIHAGVEPDPVTGALLTPIHQSTTYVQSSVDEYLAKGYSYSRSGNPTVRTLERKLNALEGGADCCAFGTGMAAINATLMGLLNAGDHAVISDVAYGGTYRLCTKVYSRFGVVRINVWGFRR